MARRYARALFDVARANQSVEAVQSGLQRALATLQESPDFFHALTNPAVLSETKRTLTERIWGDIDPLTRRLLGLLIERRRLEALGALSDEFRKLWNAERRVSEAEVATAAPLTDQESERVRAALRQALDRDVEIKHRIDPDLWGGIRIMVDGRTYDNTVRTQLNQLREHLAGGH